MNTSIPDTMKSGVLSRAAMTVAAAVALMLSMASVSSAMDQPPQEPQQQRAWLAGHLVTDMEALGTFDGNTLAKVPGIVNALTDDQVALLTQYYYLTRSKTEQDAYLYSMQQQGYTDDQVNAAKAQIADLLTAMNNQIEACYDQFVPMPQPILYIAQICYASVPGWCCHARCFVPDWYYDNGCFVGPCFNTACSGRWAAPICRAYYDHGSRFYSRYHSVANATYINHSTNVAKRNAAWLRSHGDWHNTLAHDRLLHQSGNGNRQPTVQSHPITQNHVDRQTTLNRVASLRKPRLSQVSKPKTVARQQTSKTSNASKVHSPKVVHQEAKPHVNHASAAHVRAQPMPPIRNRRHTHRTHALRRMPTQARDMLARRSIADLLAAGFESSLPEKLRALPRLS